MNAALETHATDLKNMWNFFGGNWGKLQAAIRQGKEKHPLLGFDDMMYATINGDRIGFALAAAAAAVVPILTAVGVILKEAAGVECSTNPNSKGCKTLSELAAATALATQKGIAAGGKPGNDGQGILPGINTNVTDSEVGISLTPKTIGIGLISIAAVIMIIKSSGKKGSKK